MFDKTRVIATIVMLLAIVATLLVAFLTELPGLVILCVVIQYLAFAWYDYFLCFSLLFSSLRYDYHNKFVLICRYSLSYIPFARTLFKKCVAGLF